MIKAVICILCNVIFMIINTCVLCLKPVYDNSIQNDKNFNVYYQQWIRAFIFILSIVAMLFGIHSALDLEFKKSILAIFSLCVLTICYTTVKYKCIIVEDNKITVERLFLSTLETSIENITSVVYNPSARLTVKCKKRNSFDVSFNMQNAHRFYEYLIEKDVNFKTGNIPSGLKRVDINEFNLTLSLPDKMFKENFEQKRFFHNSKHLFSARNLEKKYYIEGYLKESGKNADNFSEQVKNDLMINGFEPVDLDEVTINELKFIIIKSIDNENPSRGRLAYIYEDENSFFVMYVDYNLEDEKVISDLLAKSLKKKSSFDNILKD